MTACIRLARRPALQNRQRPNGPSAIQPPVQLSKNSREASMKANCWMGKKDVRVETVPDPQILNQRDAIVRITSTAICGSDLHLYNGFIPGMESGDILGHEFMGEVVEVGPGVRNLQRGDRVVVPFPIACGGCFSCKRSLFSLCENSNPNAWMARKRSEEHTSELQSHSFISYAVFCLK